MKFARETAKRSGQEVRLGKRHRAAALHDAGAIDCVPLTPRGRGVRQPYAAFTDNNRASSNKFHHASRITHHVPRITSPASRLTHHTSAFTLAEVLAALVFMAILIPVALEALSIATRAGEVAARKGEAALVAERVLNENVATTNWNSSVQSGLVRQGVREFNWTLRNDPWTADTTQSAMRQLMVEVKYNVQGRQYSLRMSTLVDSTPPGTQNTQVQ